MAVEAPSSSPADRMFAVSQDAGSDMTKDEAVGYAVSVCDYLEEGYTSGAVVVRMMADTETFDSALHARLVGGAIGSHCPSFAAQVNREWN